MKHFSSSRFVVGSVLVILLTAAAVVWATKGQSNSIGRLRIENKTRSLAIESMKDLGEVQAGAQNRFEVTVRNGYDKPIVTYRFRVVDSLTGKKTINAVERGGMMGDWDLPPNGADVIAFSAASEGAVVLTVAAVLFEDGTGDGNTSDLLRLQEIHAGVKTAFQKIAPILRQAANTDDSVVPDAAIQLLEDEVASINDREVPVNQRRGFAQAKDYVRLELSDLKNNLRSKPNLKHKAEFTKKLEKIEKALAKM